MVALSFLLWHWIYCGFQSFNVATGHWTILCDWRFPHIYYNFKPWVESSSMAGTDWRCARGPARLNSRHPWEALTSQRRGVRGRCGAGNHGHETWNMTVRMTGWPDDPGGKCEGIDGKKKTDQSSSQAKVGPDDLTASGQQNDGRQLPTSLGCNGPGLPGLVGIACQDTCQDVCYLEPGRDEPRRAFFSKEETLRKVNEHNVLLPDNLGFLCFLLINALGLTWGLQIYAIHSRVHLTSRCERMDSQAQNEAPSQRYWHGQRQESSARMSQVNYVDFEENEIDEIYMIEDVLRELQDDKNFQKANQPRLDPRWGCARWAWGGRDLECDGSAEVQDVHVVNTKKAKELARWYGSSRGEDQSASIVEGFPNIDCHVEKLQEQTLHCQHTFVRLSCFGSWHVHGNWEEMS